MRSWRPFCCGDAGSINSGTIPSRIHHTDSVDSRPSAVVANGTPLWLGGAHVGVLVTGVAFGAGHLLQGADAAVATGLLGMFWGIVYLRRRSAVAPMVSHAGFDLLQIVQAIGGR